MLKPGCHLAASLDGLYYVAWAMTNSGELDEIIGAAGGRKIPR